MGCKCCKIIKSYIFDPQEVQTSGYINEINNFKSDEERGKFHPKYSSDIQVRKNELQNAESQIAANRHKLNNAKDPLWNHRIAALPEKGLGKCSVNGIDYCAGVYLNAHHNKSQSKEINTYISSGKLHDSPGRRVSQPKKCDKHEVLASENPPKQPLETSDHVCREDPQCLDTHVLSMQSVKPELQGRDRDRELGSPTLLPPASLFGKQGVVEKGDLANRLAQTEQNTEGATVVHHRTQPDSGPEDPVWESSPLNAGFEDKLPGKVPREGNRRDPAPETGFEGHTKVHGEREEEDAEVAEALAALEAATAGELFEEEED